MLPHVAGHVWIPLDGKGRNRSTNCTCFTSHQLKGNMRLRALKNPFSLSFGAVGVSGTISMFDPSRPAGRR